jgi:hypothetical protein
MERAAGMKQAGTDWVPLASQKPLGLPQPLSNAQFGPLEADTT